MTGARKVLPWLVVTVLVLAGGVFGLRSWVGTEGSDERVAPNTVGQTVTPTPTPTPTPTLRASASPSAEPSPSATPRRTATPRPPQQGPAPRTTRSTAAVVSQIRSSLDAQGRATTVACPASVPAAVGTTFSCTVAYADRPGVVVADASVRITSASGRFTWRSTSRG